MSGSEMDSELPESSQTAGGDIQSKELDSAKATWANGPKGVPLPVKREHPILPLPGHRNILITSALPYVNNVPHLGNLIGSVLSADVFSRSDL